jgi:hypothetical protein
MYTVKRARCSINVQGNYHTVRRGDNADMWLVIYKGCIVSVHLKETDAIKRKGELEHEQE